MLILAFSLCSADSDAASSKTNDPTPLPQDVYPDADIIISVDAKNNTLVTFKAYGDYQPSKDHPSEWFTLTYSENKDIKLRNISDANKEMYIVFEKASVRKLTLFEVDTKAALTAAISVRFLMVSGEIQTLSMVSVADRAIQYIGKSYDVMSSPVKSASFELRGGVIDLYSPTNNMLSVTNYDLNIQPGMTIHRLLTTGENGKYSQVNVSINGARIGYMANIASKIGTLNYDIQSGTINYFCIGANTEHTSNRSLSNMATSYVTGDVSVHIGQSAEITRCIIGGGILNMPLKLCNGDILSNPIIHIVEIDAPYTTVYNDTAFLTDNRTQAYHFNSNFKVGSSPQPSSIIESFTYKNTNVKVYSSNGVWTSMFSCTIPVGGILSLNTGFFIQPKGEFNISNGATVYNMDDIILCGKMNVEGTLVNNSVIEFRSGSELLGNVQGIGLLADYVRYSTPTSAISVMSQKTAVVIDQGQSYPVESISALLGNEHRSVNITMSDYTRIYGDEFMIALSNKPPEDGFDGIYRLEIKGIDPAVLGLATVTVTLPTDRSVCTAVYVLDQSANEYVMVGTSQYESEVKFVTQDNNKFYLLEYTADKPDQPPSPSPTINTDITNFDYVLIAAIVAVLAVTIYSLLTMKRD